MLALLLTALPVCSLPAAPQGNGGNVCVIVLDDVGSGLLGSYDQHFQALGRPSAHPAATPNIDTLLAQQGISFDNAWSCPTCTPSRAAMLTGRIGSRSGIGQVLMPRDNRDNPGLEPDVELLPGLLRAAPTPYASAALGKWHLASREQLIVFPQHPLGEPNGVWFDRFAGTWFNLSRLSGLSFQASGFYVWEKAYATRVRADLSPCPGGEPPCVIEFDVNLDPNLYPSADVVNDALTVIGDLPEPWFVWIATHAAHVPAHDVPDGLPSASCSAFAPPGTSCSYPGMSLAPSRLRCSLEAVDSQLGRLLCALDFQDTTVILVSDNGSSKIATIAPYGDARAKGTVYQGGVEVPLIVRSPVVPPALRGTRSDALASLTDVFETVREFALAPPALHAEDSRSLVPILLGQTSAVRATVYAEGFAPNFVPDPATGLPPPNYDCLRHDQALRDARYKLIRKWRRNPSGGAPILDEELYDLAEGGPPNLGTVPPTPMPDWFEANDLLAGGVPLDPQAQAAWLALGAELDLSYPTLVR